MTKRAARRKVSHGTQPRVKRQIAEYLALKYAAGADLVFRDARTPRGKRTSEVRLGAAESGDPNWIVWAPESGGLTVLLHEIGHHRLEGHGTPKSALDQVVNEALAWRWAEWAARQENLWFDYALADRNFASYTRKAPLRINWRNKDVF